MLLVALLRQLHRLADGAPGFFWAPPQAPAGVQPAPVQSVLLVSERDTAHSVGIVQFLERAGARLPPPLLSFVQRVLAAREAQKISSPLCSYLKAAGVCRCLVVPVEPVSVSAAVAGSSVDRCPAGGCC